MKSISSASKNNRAGGETPDYKVAGVSGWPIHHSLSPLLHNFWLKKTGLSGAYIHFAVRPDEALRAFKSLKYTNICGMNVTLPLKSFAYKAADEVTDDAQKVGVANCLYVRGTQLIAHNTDLAGFAMPLLSRVSLDYLTNHPAVLIGAGGASRAVIAALMSIGVPEIRIINRTDERALELSEQVSAPSIIPIPWANRAVALSGAGLVINATAAGMTGKPDLDVDLSPVPEGAWVYDLVYTPLETPFMKRALAQGLNVIGGLDMLIEQARPSFKLFYGELPSPEANAKALLIKNLNL